MDGTTLELIQSSSSTFDSAFNVAISPVKNAIIKSVMKQLHNILIQTICLPHTRSLILCVLLSLFPVWSLFSLFLLCRFFSLPFLLFDLQFIAFGEMVLPDVLVFVLQTDKKVRHASGQQRNSFCSYTTIFTLTSLRSCKTLFKAHFLSNPLRQTP